MIDIELTPVSMQQVINTPFRVLALAVLTVLAAIVVINGN